MLEATLLTPEALNKRNLIRTEYSDLCERVIAELPSSRERALAITKMEESFMWITRAIEMTQSS